MSAIAGIVRQAGRPASEAAARAMLAAMAHRAPDGTAVRAAGRAVLGHGAFTTLPQDEAQPFEEGDLVITADVRLDNRDELIAALEVRDPEISDARLVLKAYRRWGLECPEQLLGDFAFAVWDRQQQTLFATRDFIGVKPFYYHQGPDLFVFASEIKGVLAEGSVPRDVSEDRIADYLAGMTPELQQTLYASVRRLPGAHALLLKDGEVTLRRYWTPPETPAFARKDAPEQLAAILESAVEARMRSPEPVCALLSGGLDSSSIAGLARPLAQARYASPLKTVSVVFDQAPQWSERPFIEAVLDEGGYDPSFMDGHQVSPFKRLDALLKAQDGLFLGHNLDLTSEVYRACAARGTRVVLNGHGGDEVISQGYGRFPELARAGRWLKLWREIKGAGEIFGNPPLPLFLEYLEHFGPGKRALPFWRKVQRKLGAPPPPQRTSWKLIINPDLAERTRVGPRRREALQAAPGNANQRDHHLTTTEPRMQTYAFEVLDRAAAAAGVEARHPFWDKRMLEFCLTLPSEEILDDGWPRLVLRRAMQGVMPPKVQWRRDKLDFTPHIIGAMIGPHRELVEAVIGSDSEDIGAYVNLPGAAQAWARVLEHGAKADGYDVQFVWRTVAFARWLAHERSLPGGARIA